MSRAGPRTGAGDARHCGTHPNRDAGPRRLHAQGYPQKMRVDGSAKAAAMRRNVHTPSFIDRSRGRLHPLPEPRAEIPRTGSREHADRTAAFTRWRQPLRQRCDDDAPDIPDAGRREEQPRRRTGDDERGAGGCKQTEPKARHGDGNPRGCRQVRRQAQTARQQPRAEPRGAGQSKRRTRGNPGRTPSTRQYRGDEHSRPQHGGGEAAPRSGISPGDVRASSNHGETAGERPRHDPGYPRAMSEPAATTARPRRPRGRSRTTTR